MRADTSHIRYFEVGRTLALGPKIDLLQAEGQAESLVISLSQRGPGRSNLLPAGDPRHTPIPALAELLPPAALATFARLGPSLAQMNTQIVVGALAPGLRAGKSSKPSDGKVGSLAKRVSQAMFGEALGAGWTPGEQGELSRSGTFAVDIVDVSGANKQAGKEYDPEPSESDEHIRSELLDRRDPLVPLARRLERPLAHLSPPKLRKHALLPRVHGGTADLHSALLHLRLFLSQARRRLRRRPLRPRRRENDLLPQQRKLPDPPEASSHYVRLRGRATF